MIFERNMLVFQIKYPDQQFLDLSEYLYSGSGYMPILSGYSAACKAIFITQGIKEPFID